MTKVLDNWQVTECDFRKLVRPFLPPARTTASGTDYYALTHDVTKLLKEHSPCLEGRQYVPTSNKVIASNKALGVGYPVSALHLGVGDAGWVPPLALERLGVKDDAKAVAVRQIASQLDDETLPFGQELCLLRADSAYGKAIFLSPMYDMESMVSIVRLRHGIKVWTKADAGLTGGAKRVYGDKFYLTQTTRWKTYKKKGQPYEVFQQSLSDLPNNEQVRLASVMGNNRSVLIDIQRWNDLLIRTKDGASMKKKPMDIVRVEVLDAQTLKRVFDRPMFIAVSGQRRAQVSSREAHEQYRERYDVESYYGFAKNAMCMDKLQTPVAAHIDPWLRIVQAASWLMFSASTQIGQIHCPPWQDYLPKNKAVREQPDLRLTIAQTQRAAHLLFGTFDPTPFLPQKSKKGKGRKQGQTQPPKSHHQVVKKPPKVAKKTTTSTTSIGFLLTLVARFWMRPRFAWLGCVQSLNEIKISKSLSFWFSPLANEPNIPILSGRYGSSDLIILFFILSFINTRFLCNSTDSIGILFLYWLHLEKTSALR
ncbi:MAG TPA: transposase [Saprospiraceae bacterium]|nr:transposase [Saprospiraceae bacterium]HMQ84773.1 transposase [Saprospiraceae bacterium]